MRIDQYAGIVRGLPYPFRQNRPGKIEYRLKPRNVLLGTNYACQFAALGKVGITILHDRTHKLRGFSELKLD